MARDDLLALAELTGVADEDVGHALKTSRGFARGSTGYDGWLRVQGKPWPLGRPACPLTGALRRLRADAWRCWTAAYDPLRSLVGSKSRGAASPLT
jgi:hypothetical protein